ncbi:hypothetical protein DU258_19655 [Salmonella enterica subsp. enterica]|uniref:Uncharacterized protein n=1 Tax=Salmonella enterica subsp. enterica serovar Macclesfield str. S-1643 TaxID=1242107 RepID=A0A2C9P4T8_SALET|nr:hypothetical protein [Salmonella enterica]ASG18436.1 hypothetical protein LFZ25_22140 [Salmonella enterica subsp. enterica serovar Macclesfield str. S-1643]EAA5485804.1 hypothetical protein [Salmonella enterica subsp. enterica serovar Kouka]EBS1108690.1 hypothetical protein [Salmonella enterica subsp. enterica serovar Eingedi]EBV2193635.1 hypothetical protein [Salmonella enterica subsp. enterica serovar Afula]ECD5050964.1 hypothetical protein [Salmonella enterica subsp. enterica serovar Eve
MLRVLARQYGIFCCVGPEEESLIANASAQPGPESLKAKNSHMAKVSELAVPGLGDIQLLTNLIFIIHSSATYYIVKTQMLILISSCKS